MILLFVGPSPSSPTDREKRRAAAAALFPFIFGGGVGGCREAFPTTFSPGLLSLSLSSSCLSQSISANSDGSVSPPGEPGGEGEHGKGGPATVRLPLLGGLKSVKKD